MYKKNIFKRELKLDIAPFPSVGMDNVGIGQTSLSKCRQWIRPWSERNTILSRDQRKEPRVQSVYNRKKKI